MTYLFNKFGSIVYNDNNPATIILFDRFEWNVITLFTKIVLSYV